MIRIKGRLATYGEIWFNEETPVNPGVDVLIYRQRPQRIENAACSLFLTLVTALDVDEGDIIHAFGKTNRYKIKRAESKDNLTSRFVSEARPQVDAFCDFYDEFARQKSLEPAYRRGITAAALAGQLVLTSACRDGKPIVRHSYICQGTTVALFHSASLFRDMDSTDRALLGRANRWLHWRDMLEFRQRGIVRYDWGGLFEDDSIPEHAGVNRFKCEFGGLRERSHDCTIAITVKGRLLMPLLNAVDRFKAMAR